MGTDWTEAEYWAEVEALLEMLFDELSDADDAGC